MQKITQQAGHCQHLSTNTYHIALSISSTELFIAFSALTLSAGHQQEHLACKN